MRYLRGKIGLAGIGVVAAVIGVTLLVVLPALATTAGQTILPASDPGGITPTDVAIGGNGVCSTIFTKLYAKVTQNLHEFDNPNPQGTNTVLPSGNNDNVTFTLTVSGPNTAQRLLVTPTTNAVIAALGIKGGNDTAAYDYVGKDWAPGVTQGWVPADGTLHAPASKYDNKGLPSQWYGLSELNACYRLVAPIQGTVFNDANGSGSPTGQSGIDGVPVTIVDLTTGGHTTVTTANGGMFSSNQPYGDSYTVCSASPGTNYTQTVPTSGASCGGLNGYTVALTDAGSSTNNFGFRSLRTISGRIYRDLNLNGTYDPAGTLTPHDPNLDTTLDAGGWTVNLYDTSSSTSAGSGTTHSNGTYSFTAPLIPNDSYKLCLSPPDTSTTWVQTYPRPTSDSPTCDSPALHWAAGFKGGSTNMTQDFGNAAGTACSSTQGMSGTDVVALMPGSTSGCLKPNTFAFATGTDPSNGGKQYVGVAVGDPTHLSEYAPVVEQITFDDPLQADGTPTYKGLQYRAGSVIDLTQMQSCTVSASQLLDPNNTRDYPPISDPALNLMKLRTQYAQLSLTESTPVLPQLPQPQTACLIKIDITGASGGTGTLTAYVYSTADSGYSPL